MAKAGYCKECGENVWLKEDGSCENGHPASGVSNVYEAKDKTKESEKKKKSLGLILIIAGIVGFVFLGCIGCAVLSSLIEPPKFEKKKTEAAKPKEFEQVKLKIDSPEDSSEVTTPTIEIVGRTEQGAKVTINSTDVLVDPTDSFKFTASLAEGSNSILVEAIKKGKKTKAESLTIYRKHVPAWVTVIELSGNSNKRSDVFELKGDKTRLSYNVSGGQSVIVSIYVMGEGHSLQQEGGFPEVTVTQPGSDSTMLAKGAGRYYLDINSANASWTVKIEEER